ncbi:DUF2066 domain-containing protein [Halopseudomonas bauzanensis]|uniref:DUF2066 domain-containing protein n=1 Tax=Halopseudomonas bauzanensis TaxID=653930 RepID=UPI003523C730
MRFKQRVRLLLLCIAALASFSLSAAVLDDLYRVQVTQAEDQSRDDALRAATRVMLQRLVGNEVELQRGPLAAALKSPPDVMRRIGTAEGGKLHIEFEPEALNRLVRDAGLPALGRNRPGIVLWAVEAGELGDRTLSPVSASALILKEAAAHRGVALSFPLGDLQDMSQVDEQLIRQASRDELLAASERYPAEGTVALTVSGSADQSVLDWTLWLNDQSDSGRITGTAEAAADKLMVAIASAVFAQYATPAGAADGASGWRLHVEGINSVADYAGLLRSVNQLGSQAPQLIAIEGDKVQLQVSFAGSEAQLERLLNLDMRLQRMPEPVVEPEPEPEPALSGTEQDDASADLFPIPADSTAPALDPNAESMPDLANDPSGESLATPEPQQVVPTAPPAPALPTLYFRWRS